MVRPAAILALTLLLSPVSTLALEGTDEWDQQIDSNGIITLTDGTILIQGSNNAGPGYPWQNTVTGLTTDSSVGETVSFDWSYWTTDGAFYDRAQMLLNESWIDLSIWDQAGYNSLQQNGTQAVYIAAGGIFGFRILSTDSCCGAGFLQITNTTWVVGPAPTPTPEPSVDPSPEPSPTPEPTPEPTPLASLCALYKNHMIEVWLHGAQVTDLALPNSNGAMLVFTVSSFVARLII